MRPRIPSLGERWVTVFTLPVDILLVVGDVQKNNVLMANVACQLLRAIIGYSTRFVHSEAFDYIWTKE